MDDALKEFFKYLGVFVASILTVWLKQLIDERKKKIEARKQKERHEMQFTVEFDLRIKNVENELMRQFHPCRIFVFNFNNGEFSEAGLPYIKISMWHEVVEGAYVPYMSPHYQPPRMCPNKFFGIIKDCFDNGFHYLESREDVRSNNPPLYEYMTTWEIESMMWMALSDIAGATKAILVMHWPRKKYRDEKELLRMRREKHAVEKIYRELKHVT